MTGLVVCNNRDVSLIGLTTKVGLYVLINPLAIKEIDYSSGVHSDSPEGYKGWKKKKADLQI